MRDPFDIYSETDPADALDALYRLTDRQLELLEKNVTDLV